MKKIPWREAQVQLLFIIGFVVGLRVDFLLGLAITMTTLTFIKGVFFHKLTYYLLLVINGVIFTLFLSNEYPHLDNLGKYLIRYLVAICLIAIGDYFVTGRLATTKNKW